MGVSAIHEALQLVVAHVFATRLSVLIFEQPAADHKPGRY